MLSYVVDILANFAVATINFIGYPGIFLLMLVESAGIPIPSEIIMPFSGFLVFAGQMNFWLVAILGALGNLAGSLLAYYIGLKGGRPLIEKYGKYLLLSKHDLDTAEKWFSKHGDSAVFFGRLLPVIRTYISFPAGITKMSVKKFGLFTFAGCLPWAFFFTWLGIKLGNNWGIIREQLHNFDIAILIAIAMCVVFYIWRRKKKIRKVVSEIKNI